MTPTRRAAAALTLCGWVLTGCGNDKPALPLDRPSGEPGFEEVAAAAGLDFENQFLETEQGLDFKVNLYDHGSGVAVADHDGDGLEDLYFCNQMGANALYRNRGDGTFERIEIRWPSGLVQQLGDLAVDSVHDVVEPDDGPK